MFVVGFKNRVISYVTGEFWILVFPPGKHIQRYCDCFWLLYLNFAMECFLGAFFSSSWTVKISVFDLACEFCAFTVAFVSLSWLAVLPFGSLVVWPMCWFFLVVLNFLFL